LTTRKPTEQKRLSAYFNKLPHHFNL